MCLLPNEDVLSHVASIVCLGMLWTLDKHITVATRLAAIPAWIAWPNESNAQLLDTSSVEFACWYAPLAHPVEDGSLRDAELRRDLPLAAPLHEVELAKLRLRQIA